MPTPNIAIRPYCADDLAATVDLWYRSWCGTFPDIKHPLPRDQWDIRFAEDIATAYALWIAERGKNTVGFLALDLDRGYLDQIFVDPAEQGHGVGSALMTKAKALCPSGLRLHALQQNAAALRFYERHGFQAGEAGVNPHNKQPTVAFVWKP